MLRRSPPITVPQSPPKGDEFEGQGLGLGFMPMFCPRAQVLKDGRLPKEVRRLRAQGLRELGGLFLDAAAVRQEVAPAAQDDQVRPRGRPCLFAVLGNQLDDAKAAPDTSARGKRLQSMASAYARLKAQRDPGHDLRGCRMRRTAPRSTSRRPCSASSTSATRPTTPCTAGQAACPDQSGMT